MCLSQHNCGNPLGVVIVEISLFETCFLEEVTGRLEGIFSIRLRNCLKAGSLLFV